MKINKNGFTLVELLAVIALLAILTGITVPNILSTINNNKKNTFLMDAKRMVTKAEYLKTKNKNDRDYIINNPATGKTYYLNDLNESGEFLKDADGGNYQEAYVKVTYDINNKVYKYCIYVNGSRRSIGTSTSCLSSGELTGIDVVDDK